MMPTLTIVTSLKDSPVRKSVVPQSGQKWLVIEDPLSAVLEMVLGVPDTRLKADEGTPTLVL